MTTTDHDRTPDCPDRLDAAIAAWAAILLLFAATLSVGFPSDGLDYSTWPAGLRAIAVLLNVPIYQQPAHEIRRAFFFLIVGACLVFDGIRRWRSPAPDSPGGAIRFARPFTLCLAGTLGIGALSWLVNRTGTMSLGWMAQFVVGACWALWLAARADAKAVDRITTGVAWLVIVTTILVSWHLAWSRYEQTDWPIGSVTATGFVSAVWAAWFVPLGLGALVGLVRGRVRTRRDAIFALLRMLALVAAFVLLFTASRQGAIIGVALGTVVALAVHWRTAAAGSWRRRTSIAIVVACAAGAVGWSYMLATGRFVNRVGSIRARLVMYDGMTRAIRERPLLGFGPDSYVADMTTRLASGRAQSPAIYHADIANAGHNEWLQAIMELGIPGGIAYLLIPLSALLIAARAYQRCIDRDSRIRIAGLIAALASLIIAETSSIMLRGQLGPPWYWTILGLLLAASRAAPLPIPQFAPPPARTRALAGAAVAIGLLACLAGVVGAWTSREHARGLAAMSNDTRLAAEHLRRARLRLDAVEWIRARWDLAAARSVWIADHRAAATPDDIRAAADAWGEVYEICPGMPESGARRAELLMMLGDQQASQRVVRETVDRINPYSLYCNLRLARATTDLAAQLDYACHAIRNGQIEGDVDAFLREIKLRMDESPEWRARVARAYEDRSKPIEEWRDPLMPEVLRIEAWRLASNGQLNDARDVANAAAFATSRGAGTPGGRFPLAEVEAWTLNARLTYAADPRDYARALDCIDTAEERAINIVQHIARRPRTAPAELIGDRMVPTEFPANLRSMWTLSAMLHLAGGRTKFLGQRVFAALPPEERSPERIQRVIADLAAQLHNDFAAFPSEQRPPNYPTYIDWVRQYDPVRLRPATTNATTQP